MTLVLGVDGGGTKTHALVADHEGRVLGASVGGPSNWELVGVGGTGAILRVAVMEALDAAGLEPAGVEASVVGPSTSRRPSGPCSSRSSSPATIPVETCACG